MAELEPWMRGGIADVHPVIAAVLYSFQHALEDIEKRTAPLSDEQLWRKTADLGSVGFHVLHLAGSVERLVTYACGAQLSEQQLAELKREPGARMERDQLMRMVRDRFANAERTLRSVDPSQFASIRELGRKRIPVPLGTLIVHIAEHTQRHIGEAIVTAKVVRASA